MQTHGFRHIFPEGFYRFPIQQSAPFKGSRPRDLKAPGSDFETEYTFKPAINNTLPRKAPERMSD
jgi:hypothetical protein